MAKAIGRSRNEYGPCERDLAIWLGSELMGEHGRYDPKKLKAVSKAIKKHNSKVYELVRLERHFRVDEVPLIAAVLGAKVPASCRWK